MESYRKRARPHYCPSSPPLSLQRARKFLQTQASECSSAARTSVLTSVQNKGRLSLTPYSTLNTVPCDPTRPRISHHLHSPTSSSTGARASSNHTVRNEARTLGNTALKLSDFYVPTTASISCRTASSELQSACKHKNQFAHWHILHECSKYTETPPALTHNPARH
jgi:hypothetical protein